MSAYTPSELDQRLFDSAESAERRHLYRMLLENAYLRGRIDARRACIEELEAIARKATT